MEYYLAIKANELSNHEEKNNEHKIQTTNWKELV